MDLSIIMYHYVRPLQLTRFPEIRGLDVAEFENQLDQLMKHHTIISLDDLLDDSCAYSHIPPRAVLLTFDDGFSDHYEYVLPRLIERGITGSFFPPCTAVAQRQLLDVHRVHFLLASTFSLEFLAQEMEREIRRLAPHVDIGPLRKRWYVRGGLDPAPVLYVKRLLQVGLPRDLRHAVTDALFRRLVTTDEAAFAEELYLDIDQLQMIRALGMHVGGHGDTHQWMGTLSEDEIHSETGAMKGFLHSIGVDAKSAWSIAYPYGDFTERVQAILRAHGCRIGPTTRSGVASLAFDDVMALPRIDTVSLADGRFRSLLAD